jgi:hypothetical protein
MSFNNNEADAAAGMVVAAAAANDANNKNHKKTQTQQLTKRQRRKMVNDKHKWANFPKIQDATQRANAYLRSAGLLLASHNKEKEEKDSTITKPKKLHQRQQQNEQEEEENRRNVKFGRRLGSPDARVRHKTVLQLKEYLKARCAILQTQDDDDDKATPSGVSELDLLKLTKCLWHTLYMCDRTVVQDELSKVMSELIWCFAGTEEADEYAAAVYLQQTGHDDDDDDCGCDDDDDGDVQDDEWDEEDEIDDEENAEELQLMEVDEEEEEEEESSTDTTQKQIALLENGEDTDDDNDDDNDDDTEDLEIPHCQGAHLASLYLRVWFRTIVREWGMLDKYRIDKFYLLLRYLVSQMYKYMAQRHWNIGIIQLFNDALYEEVLIQTPNGIRYHIIDVVLQELALIDNSKETPIQLTEATFLDVLEPFFAMAQTGAGGDNTVQARVIEKVLLGFLEKYSVISDDAVQYHKQETIDNKKEETGMETTTPSLFENVHVGTVAEFIFQLASDPSCEENSRFRKSVYETHKSYQRRLQTYLEHDVDIGSLHQNNSDNDEDELEDDPSEMDEEKETSSSHPKHEAPFKSNGNKTHKAVDRTKQKEEEKPKRKVDNTSDQAPSDAKSNQQKSAKKEQSGKRNDERQESSKGDGLNVEVNSNQKISPSKVSLQHQKSEQTDASSAVVEKKKIPRNQKTEKTSSKNKEICRSDPHTKSSNHSKLLPPERQEEKVEEEITITVADQKAAKQALQQKQQVAEQQQSRSKEDASKKKRRQHEVHDDTKNRQDAGKKRVKFGNNNKARSWHASMQALHTMETPPIPRASPDKGILLNKQQQQQQQQQRHSGRKNHGHQQQQHYGNKKKKGGRQKASDYFF